jgi:hypothetical protein
VGTKTPFVNPKELVLDSIKGPRHPFVILAFDESHTLTDTPRDESRSVFSELRRVLGELVDLPIFSLSLSTSSILPGDRIRPFPSRRKS